MALPANVIVQPSIPTTFGCALALYPADTGYAFEIQRAPDSGGSPDTGNAEIVGAVPGDTDVFVDERPGDGATYHYRIRHVRSGEDASPWTGWLALEPTELRFAYRPAPLLPGVTENPTDDGATGTLTLEISDPQNRLVSVEAKSRSGNGTEEANWQTLSDAGGGVYTDTVDLAEKHPSTIRYRIVSYDEHGGQVVKERVVPFPLASKPAKPQVTLTIDASGNVDAHVEGDPDTANVRGAASKSAYPNAATVDAEDPVAGQSVDLQDLINLNNGETAYVSVRAYDSGGNGSELAKARISATSDEFNDPPSDPVLSSPSVFVGNVRVAN